MAPIIAVAACLAALLTICTNLGDIMIVAFYAIAAACRMSGIRGGATS